MSNIVVFPILRGRANTIAEQLSRIDRSLKSLLVLRDRTLVVTALENLLAEFERFHEESRKATKELDRALRALEGGVQ